MAGVRATSSKCTLRARQVAGAVSRHADVVVNRGPLHSQGQALLVQQLGRGKNPGFECGARFGEACLGIAGGRLRAAAEQQSTRKKARPQRGAPLQLPGGGAADAGWCGRLAGFSGRRALVVSCFLGALFRVLGNLFTEFPTLVVSIRCACCWPFAPGSLGLPDWLGGAGGRLRRLGERNPAHDFVGYFGIRIHDDMHRDIEIVTIARRRRLREHRRNDERQQEAKYRRRARRMMPSLLMRCHPWVPRRAMPRSGDESGLGARSPPRPVRRPVARAITGSDSRFAPCVSEVVHSISCCSPYPASATLPVT